ncbi:MAG: hypothetical protein LBJ32_01135 [Oscillospiraceae bacterium]|jgi:hypothetical protein|nr:hypothetical protein [Oscillospiraceae bacterium]
METQKNKEKLNLELQNLNNSLINLFNEIEDPKRNESLKKISEALTEKTKIQIDKFSKISESVNFEIFKKSEGCLKDYEKNFYNTISEIKELQKMKILKL